MTSVRQAGPAATADKAPPVLVEQAGEVRWLYLNRPERRNALTPVLIAVLDQAVADAIADPDTKVIVVAGRGPSFCAGADLRYLLELAETGNDPAEFLAAVSECFTRIERAGKPVVAAVHGHAVAGGLELALACDAVVARSDTLLGDGHVRNGLLPGGGASRRLPRKLGEPLARWLMLTGELVPAEQLVAGGFVHAVVPQGCFHDEVAAVAARLAATTAGTRAGVKRLLFRWDERSPEEAKARELEIFAENWVAADVRVGLNRFVHREGRG